MSIVKEQDKEMELVNTNCSINEHESSEVKQQNVRQSKEKRKIGRYSFYLKDMIGKGYSSKVYKGVKDNNKSQWYAIKAIKLKNMNVANIYMLNNEIEIIQDLQHQNIVKFVDVYQTNTHCYLVTEYCEGGNLEKYAKHNQHIQWGSIIYQISQGCQYLANKNIVHRDLKPANVFLKQGKWKIGDFGFSKRIPNLDSLIIQHYKIGSPLFMPLQTLQRNMYSSKSDSFALGVIIYFLIFKQFPWSGSTLSKLIKNYKEKVIQQSLFELLPKQIISIVKDLCNMNMKERLPLSSCDFNIFLRQKSIKQIDQSLLLLKEKVGQQVRLCQFINYLIMNSMLFLEDNHIIYSLMSNNLYHLTNLFSWPQSKSLKQIQDEYILPIAHVKVTQDNYRKIIYHLKIIIQNVKLKSQSHVQQVALEKLLQYYCICKYILNAQSQKLSQFLKTIVLHKNFNDLQPNLARIESLAKIVLQNQ